MLRRLTGRSIPSPGRSWGKVVLMLVLALGWQPGLPAQEAPPTSEGPGGAWTVKAEPIRLEHRWEGVVEAARVHPLSLAPKVWRTLIIQRVLPAGEHVRKGDPVLWLETEGIDRRLEDVRYELEQTELELKLAELELRLARERTPLSLEAAERALRQAREDLDYFLSVERNSSARRAEFNVQSAEYSLEYAQEELNQLEKMYKADEITEETEEIILKRARRDVERARYFLEEARINAARTLERELPRREVQLQEAVRQAELQFEEKRVSLPVQLHQKELQLTRLRSQLQRTQQELARLEEDRQQMVLRAPADGVLYYGQPTGGQWPDLASAQRQLQPGSSVSPHQALVSVVEVKPLRVRFSVPEGALRDVRPGVEVVVIPDAFPEQPQKGTIAQVSPIPVKSGTFEAVAEFSTEPPVVPGMSCSVRLLAYQREQALVVPDDAVEPDPEKPGTYRVQVLQSDGTKQWRTVRLGRRVKDRWEVLDGLKEGEKVVRKDAGGSSR